MSTTVQGVDFDKLVSLGPSESVSEVLHQGLSCGLQATNLSAARLLVQEALALKRSGVAHKVVCSYTSNLVSCGVREALAFLARNRLVDAFVSTGGGVEEDVIKCLGKTLIGDFSLVGKDLRQRGLNRIGNLLVPNDNYCAFEDFFLPVIERLHAKQRECRWEAYTSPSEVIREIGASMEGVEGRETSLVYWCYKHNIPLFCPAFTDGSMGDMIYFYNFSKKGFVVDPILDVDRLKKCCAGECPLTALVLGGGLPRHHLQRAASTREGAMRVVMITTGAEADGCVSSCTLSDDVREGLLRADDTVVRIQGDAAMLFPLIL